MFKYSEKTYEVLDSVLSGILHNINEDTYSDIEELTRQVLTLVVQNECTGFYYVFLEQLIRITRLKTIKSQARLIISKKSFETFLNVGMNRFVVNKNVNIQGLMQQYGVNHNMNTPEGLLGAKNFLYSLCVTKYDELANVEISIADAYALLDSLYDSIITDMSYDALHKSAEILENGLNYNKKDYRGPVGYFEFTKDVIVNYTRRTIGWNKNQNNILTINTIEDYNRLTNEYSGTIYKLGNYLIPPLDAVTSIMSSDITSIIGDEGTGKTNYLVMESHDQICNGFSSVFMCGESKPVKILNMYLSRHIFVTTGFQISWKTIIDGIDKLPVEMQAVVNEAKHDLFTNPKYGKIHLVSKFGYATYTKEVLDIISAFPNEKFGQIFIDHADKLDKSIKEWTGGYLRTQKERVDCLFEQIVDLKILYNIGANIAVHTGADAAKEIARGKDAGKRIGASSSATTKDVDVALHLEAGPALEKKGLVKFRPLKFRETPIDKLKPIIVKRNFVCVNYIYSEALQAELGLDDEDNKQQKLEDADLDSLIDKGQGF